MSEVNKNKNAKVWAPPVFPMQGRLPGDVVTVTANYKKQIAEEVCYQQGVDSNGQIEKNGKVQATSFHSSGCMGKMPIRTSFPCSLK